MKLKPKTDSMRMRGYAFAVMLLLAQTLFAGGFQVSLQSIKHTGMAHTGVANPLDGSALFFNPGGLSFTANSSINVSAYMLFPKLQFKEEGTGKIYSSAKGPAFPFAAYWAWNAKQGQPWKIGLGVYTPYGSQVDWGTTWAGRYVLTSTSLRTIHIQPTFSYNIGKRVGVGAGFVYSRGSVALSRAIPLTLSSGLDGQAKLSGTAGGYGFNAGVLVRITPKVDVGVSYKSAIKYKANNGTAEFTVPNALRDSFPDTDISTTLQIPWALDAGITYRPDPKLAISLDVNYAGWKVYDTIFVDFKDNTSVLEDNILPRNFKNSFTIRLGGSYDIDSSFTLRAGTYLDINAVPDGFVPPETPDSDRFAVTLGGTVRTGKRFELDFSVTYLEGVRRVEKQADNYANLGGTYRGRGITIGLGLNFNLGKKPKPQNPENPVQP